mmetsp:Transcript_1969/g.5941  ORF Transcript_1969/g.5941 Transcript_1969/m.5941 type:complete len:404 (+) Transcript_1969:182-1393(+)
MSVTQGLAAAFFALSATLAAATAPTAKRRPSYEPKAPWATACGAAARASMRASCEGLDPSNHPRVQLYGERHSGTNYVAQLLVANFRVQPELHPKNTGFPFHKHIMRLAPGNEARFVQDVAGRGFPSLVVTRNAFDWILGMHRLSHHARWMERLSLEEYTSTPWQSLDASKRLSHVDHWNARGPLDAAMTTARRGRRFSFEGLEWLPNETYASRQERARAWRFALIENRTARGSAADYDNAFAMRTAKHRVWRKALLDPAAPPKAPAMKLRYEDVVADLAGSLCTIAATLELCPRGEQLRGIDRYVAPGDGAPGNILRPPPPDAPAREAADVMRRKAATNAAVWRERPDLAHRFALELDAALERFYGYPVLRPDLSAADARRTLEGREKDAPAHALGRSVSRR